MLQSAMLRVSAKLKIFAKTLISSYVALLVPLVGGLGGLVSCDDTDKYYEELRREPEIWSMHIYDEVYGVGDTLTLYGRFLSDDLTVNIGDAEAPVIEKKNVDTKLNESESDEIQRVKVRITEAMGIGEDRPVSVTAIGITITGSSIEIIPDSKAAVLDRALKADSIAPYPGGYSPVYCWSGSGNMYFIDSVATSLIRMAADGSTTTLPFGAETLKDSNGTSFTVSRLNGCGINPDERWLYLSLYQTAPRRSYYDYYRLCRYNLQDGTFEVLNKTPYDTREENRTEEAAKPFEGAIADVKMFTATGVYPAADGSVYFDMNGRFVTRLDVQGTYTYLLKNNYDYVLAGSFIIDPAPQIYSRWDAGGYKEYKYLRDELLPATSYLSYFSIYAFDLDKGWLYFRPGSRGLGVIQQYDLTGQKAGSVIGDNYFDSSLSRNKPYCVGSFKRLNYSDTNFGVMPWDGQLLLLKFQDLRYYSGIGDPSWIDAVPAWAVVDFAEQNGKFYAPGKFYSGYTMDAAQDKLMNYDAQGMLYMTANSKSAILKTVYK